MVHTFQCPNCHASLDYQDDSHALTLRCAYCNSTIIVPESLRHPEQPASVIVSAGDQGQKLVEINRLVRAGQKIAAIKLFRETFDVGLKEAKDVVEAMERNEVIRLGSAASQVDGGDFIGPGESVNASKVGRAIGCWITAILLITTLGVIVPLVFGFAGFFAIGSSEIMPSLVQEPISIISESVGGATPSAAATATPAFAEVSLQFGGQEGIGPGFFKDTRRIGVDGQGYIYTGDYSDGRIQVHDANGKFVTQWIVNSDLYMVGMAVDRQGVVYVIERGPINRYDGLSGEPLGPLTLSGQTTFRTLSVAPDGSVVAMARDRLVRFDARGATSLDLRDPFANVAGFRTTHESMAVDGAGNIYILGEDAVFKFDGAGKFINRIGSKGKDADQFQSTPTAIAVDGQGRLFVADFKGILVFDSNGRHLTTIAFGGVAFSMVFNDQNELFVMDRNGNQVLKYTLNGR
jgi:DNA-directed RNA polymerase subunit RPC12/RpoP